MKTSDRLLVGLLVLGVLTLVGSTVALRSEYDKIDFNDPFYGFTATSIRPFRILKIQSADFGISAVSEQGTQSIGLAAGVQPPNRFPVGSIGVQAGGAFEIRLPRDNPDPFKYQSVGDTLIIRYQPRFTSVPPDPGEAFRTFPSAFIIAPSLQTIIATDVSCQVEGFQTDRLLVLQDNARMILRKTVIGALTATGQRGSLLRTGAVNRIGSAAVTSRDSSGFVADQDVFSLLKVRSDSNATLSVPGSLQRQIQ